MTKNYFTFLLISVMFAASPYNQSTIAPRLLRHELFINMDENSRYIKKMAVDSVE